MNQKKYLHEVGQNLADLFYNQNKMKELKEMAYYINCTRTDQVVQIKALQRGKLWYEVIRQHDKNTINEFCCSQERFKNLYIEKK